MPVRGTVRGGRHALQLDGADGFIDDSAGYHARHTAWRWSAGIGRAEDGSAGGLEPRGRRARHARGQRAHRWIDGEAKEVPPQEFAADLSRVGELDFREWSAREATPNLVVVRNRYRQPFGEFAARSRAVSPRGGLRGDGGARCALVRRAAPARWPPFWACAPAGAPGAARLTAGPADGRRVRRPPRPHAGGAAGARARGRSPLRLRADVRARAGRDRGRRPRALPHRDAARARAGPGLPGVPHAA